MSEYTPTTGEVRAAFVSVHTRNFDAYQAGRSLESEEEHYGDQFDRWLAQHDASVARTLTPDVITDEMVRRAKAELEARAGGDYYPETLEAVLTAALTEPPARPEGAEEWEDWLIEVLPHESMPDEDIARLADQIAARAARRDEDPSGPLRPLTTDERSYRYAQDLGYELPEDPR